MSLLCCQHGSAALSPPQPDTSSQLPGSSQTSLVATTTGKAAPADTGTWRVAMDINASNHQLYITNLTACKQLFNCFSSSLITSLFIRQALPLAYSRAPHRTAVLFVCLTEVSQLCYSPTLSFTTCMRTHVKNIQQKQDQLTASILQLGNVYTVKQYPLLATTQYRRTDTQERDVLLSFT